MLGLERIWVLNEKEDNPNILARNQSKGGEKLTLIRDMGNLNKSWHEPTLQFVEIPAGAKPLSFPFCSQIQEKMPTLYGDMRGLFLF